MKYYNQSKNIKDIFYKLISIQSDTNTKLERDIEDNIYTHIKNIKYFSNNPKNCGEVRLENDIHNRSIVWGLVKGKGDKTIILLHHHDAVDIDDYGILEKYALNPSKLQENLEEVGISDDIKKDLKSEEWIFGRGTADMKAGAAIQLYLLEKYSEIKDLVGNILLISVPDEETFSSGMRKGIDLLEDIKNKHNLDYLLAINSEPHGREEKEVGVLYEGSVGKVLPIIYVRGKQSHTKDVFSGINPISILANIWRNIELSSFFSDKVEDEITPPPSFGCFKDLKGNYDVSSPKGAMGYFSILTLNRTPEELLNQLKETVKGANRETNSFINNRIKEYEKKGSIVSSKSSIDIQVKTFDEIYDMAYKNLGEEFINNYNKTLKEINNKLISGDISFPDGTSIIIKETLKYIGNNDPIVVIGLVPPYYNHVSNHKLNNLNYKVKNISKEINKFTIDKWNESYIKKNYFMGISDMSYFSVEQRGLNLDKLTNNMPLWGDIYSIPFDKIKDLSIPTINIGPWGKDLHKYTERVNKKDLLERTPKIIEYGINYVLGRENKL
ncbi:M20/M25/M40 family metallo-hydrolase [Dethiothermospora halolimnae]|uniref:M20/M25/M40 family metallo-hydrolase n=1 Tax=Dethiothermospora halolimnae TaxID=3114390 RepID=UPI003CCBA532